MTITRQPNGKYRVIHFETNHNHIFVTPLTARLLPSQKRISFVEAVQAESASNSVPYGIPKLGMGFDSEDHAYEFYNSYAGRMGFSVRKDYVNRSKIDGAVASRRYTCFREGYRQKDKRGFKVKRPRFISMNQVEVDAPRIERRLIRCQGLTMARHCGVGV
ncbi:Far1-related sequence 5 isoform 1 [Dorcoceras hygrometricum]|uniref:Far1-related sequence 5 isoform 1 n=1 Tax=Dorcoceras hygrometricum TaxID=472368 RepID=A0A2Z7CGB5_9LAMI|nr:Far1-related sequence 5 isoform 1 [Dorcoceras hygrometricum]